MQKNKSNKKFIILLILILISTFLLYRHFNNNELESNVDIYTASSSTFTIMLEQEDGSYKSSDEDTWPSYADYKYNSSATTCTDALGNTVSVDISFDESGSQPTITATGNTQAYCKLYFDIRTDEGYCINNGITNLAECVLRSENESSTLSEAKTYIKSKGTPDFSETATTDEGLYYAEDDYGDSFYFRGAVTDNYVSYAGYTWRIVRINGDGSIRIILNELLDGISFNEYQGANAYVGYMYGTVNATSYNSEHENKTSSNVKKYVDLWYKSNILYVTDGTYSYATYLSDTLFCNDRSVYTGNGYSTNITYYGAHNRVFTNYSPILTCPQPDDAFTVSDTTNGNGALTYPIALITIDEVAMAGGVRYIENNDYYLRSNGYFWTMTPRWYSGSSSVSSVDSYGMIISTESSSSARAVRPVVNLRSDIIITSGAGTSSNPYVVALSS